MERQECQDKQLFCYGWKKKYKLFIVTLATLTIQWERSDNKWADSNMAE